MATGPVLVPVPVRLTDCGLPLALSAMVIAPLRVPVAVGVKVTMIVQLPPAATELPQVLFWAKSPPFVPVTAIELIVNCAPPMLVKVTAWGLLVVPVT